VLASGTFKRDLLLRADHAARAADPRVKRVEASLAESYREVLVATSDGRLHRDVQPMIRFGVRVVVEHEGKRQAGSSGGGGRKGLEYFLEPGRSPEEHAREAARLALAMLDARGGPRGRDGGGARPRRQRDSPPRGRGPRARGRLQPQGREQLLRARGHPRGVGLCTVVDRGDLDHGRGSINVDDEGNVPGSTTLIEGGILRGYLHDTCRRGTSR
jgi:TldD protein